MKRALALCLLLAACASTSTELRDSTPHADEAAPVGMHAYLARYLGEWTLTAEVSTGPDGPPMEMSSVETVRSIGHRWIVSEMNTEMTGAAFHSMLTVGYDAERDRFVASWVDSMTPQMWTYDGWLDESGTALTLETQGPDFSDPNVTRTYRDVTRFVDADHRELSSYVDVDGEWVRYMTGRAERVR